jgi:hypothetical protein
MSHIVFTNNASALLAASIAPAATAIQVAAGYGDLFPSPGAGESFQCTLEDNAGNIEIVQCTSRASDILTCVRAQEGTTAQSFTLTVTRVELRITKAVLEEFLQLDGGTLTGDLDLNTNSLIDAYISGSQTRITQGQIVGVPLRGLIDISTNEIAVPVNGTSRATAGGAALLVDTDDLIPLLDVAGVITLSSATVGVEVPAGAYFRVEGATAANHMSIVHDDTDCAITFPNTGEVTWDTQLVMAAPILMAGNEIQFVSLVDFSLKQQTVSGIATTVVDYELGSYITLNLTVDIGTLTLDNPPAVDVGVFRFKIIQDATPRTITWPAGVKWPRGGGAPSLSTGEDEIDFVDIWTDDGGTTWYGASNTNWV